MSNTKAPFFKKAVDRFSLKKKIWDQLNVSYRMTYVMSFEHEVTFRRTVYHTKQQISGGVTTMRRGQQKPAHEKHVLHPLIVSPDLGRTYGRQQPRRSIAAAS